MCYKETILQLLENLKMVPKVNKCCCCFSLHTGSYLIGIFTILQGISMVKLARFSFEGIEIKLHPGKENYQAMFARHVLCSLQVLAGNFIAFGVFFKIPLYLRASSFVLLFDWGAIIVLSATAVDLGGQKIVEFFLFSFSSCMIFHFFKVLWSYCIQMEREPDVEFPTDTFPSKMYIRAISPLLE